MPRLPEDVFVAIFDPVLPFERVKPMEVGVDTWHDNLLITKKIRKLLPHIEECEELGVLELSGGMSLRVPVVSIGLLIGSIEIPEIRALVVDSGQYDLLLGSSIFGEIFRANTRKSDGGPSSKAASSSEDLVIELYPVTHPFNVKNFESVLKNQRKLYNIALIALKKIDPSGLPIEAVEVVIAEDEGIPDHLILKITSIKSGSIWTSFSSGSRSALKYLASLFERGASAKLAQELAEADNSQVKAQVSKATRDSVAVQIRSENDRLSAENIHMTYEAFRKECRARLSFLDDLINKLEDPTLITQLRKSKEQAILEMAEQQMVPIVRNVPGSHFSLGSNYLALPASTDGDP
jgi:hypothetical protein